MGGFNMRKKLLAAVLIGLCLLGTNGMKNKVFLTSPVETQTISPVVEEKVNSESKLEVVEIKGAEEEAKEEAKNIVITSVGDIMMHDSQIRSGSLGNGKYDYSIMFKSIKPYIEKADFALGNLETTLVGSDKKYTGYPMFNAPEVLAKNLKDSGFDMVTTANNHSLDRRFYGVVKTIENLDKAGLLHIGSYKSQQDSESIFIKDINGIKVAFLAYTYATNGITVPEKFAVNLINMSKISEDIKKAKSLKVDMIIASMHFGIEYKTTQNKTQEDLVNFLFKNGVDVVLGSHPHVLQPMTFKKIKDVYGDEKDRFVIYSQGNIVANMPQRYKNSGVIINLNIRKDKTGTTVEKVDYIPTVVDSYYNSKLKKSTFEILPIFTQNDYTSHVKSSVIKQSFNDSIGILKSTDPRIAIKKKE
jgi:poly-gamma-glutamate synthesis protein (capsule biosynthesis protein)